jgi:hypothetical protein
VSASRSAIGLAPRVEKTGWKVDDSCQESELCMARAISK